MTDGGETYSPSDFGAVGVFGAARAALDAGLCVLPPREDGTKAPDATKWTDYQELRSTHEDLERWYGNGRTRTGLGLVCGAVSGGLELLDFDAVEVYDRFKEAAAASGLCDLVERIEAGYLERTPNGVHWFYRCDEISGNTPLAKRRLADGKIKSLIETRGEGGYAVTAPSHGRVHGTGKPYRLERGGFATITNLAAEERKALFELARTFDEIPKAPPREQPRTRVNDGERPGDRFNREHTWQEILERHGWTRVFERAGTTYWRRPGKTFGVSATTNHTGADTLHVFSTSTPFEVSPHSYDKFGAWALLEHGGDLAAAAAALVPNRDNRTVSEPESATRHASAARAIHPTDLGNARRLCARIKDLARFRMPPNEWMIWNGRHWTQDDQGQVIRFAKETVIGIYGEAGEAAASDLRAELAKHAIKSESARAIASMVELAKTEPGIPADPKSFDADPWLFNVLNGTIDLHTGELREHRRSDFITKIAPVTYVPDANSDRFRSYLDLVLPNAELRDFVQRAIGYSMTGLQTEERLFFVFGPTASGKSTLLESVKATFGSYAMTADFDTFLARRDVGSPRPDVARLAGARFVSSIEVEQGKHLAEGLVKTLTGGDTITARELYQRSFEFMPQCTLWLAANDEPRVRDDDGALWRRILQVPFSVSIPEADQNPEVKAQLRDPTVSGAAILAWAVAGCLKWQEIGLAPPPAVLAATKSYRERMDPLAEFLDERCELGKDDSGNAFSISVADLYDAYVAWAKDARLKKPFGKKAFGTRLAKRPEVDRDRDEDLRRWIGIKLRSKVGG